MAKTHKTLIWSYGICVTIPCLRSILDFGPYGLSAFPLIGVYLTPWFIWYLVIPLNPWIFNARLGCLFVALWLCCSFGYFNIKLFMFLFILCLNLKGKECLFWSMSNACSVLWLVHLHTHKGFILGYLTMKPFFSCHLIFSLG